MDDKTKNILSALSPAYAISQGKGFGVMGLIGNERSRRKIKKEEAKQKLIDEAAKKPQMMREGGMVRGAGKARQGVRPCKMR